MALFSIDVPPGLFRNGTELESMGRNYDADLMRFPNGSPEPIGGVRLKTTETVEGVARAIKVWIANDGQVFIAIGTHTHLYAMDRAGVLYDITPVGFTGGLSDSDFRGGYGNGLYGMGTYGTPRADTTTPVDVSVWSLTCFGEHLLGCTADDGTIWIWELNTAAPATALPNAPTARAVVVTAERIVMALGANGNPRSVMWSDQEDAEDWTPGTTDYAGDFNLQSAGRLMCGVSVRGGTLLLTDADVWLATFLGFPLVYGFTQTGGAGTGIIAQGAVAALTGEAVPVSAIWMGEQGFFGYNGSVQPIDCEIASYVFDDINRSQKSKVTAWHNADFAEVWFFYPSASSTECDRAAVWDYKVNCWTIHNSLINTCGTEKGPLDNPMAVDAEGNIYERETGLDLLGNEPFLETAPIALFSGDGEGAHVQRVRKIYPDVQSLGDVSIRIFGRNRPTGAETDFGTFNLTEETDVRLSARYLRYRVTGEVLAPWRLGKFSVDVVPDGRR